jgi:uncharacterized membrane protein YkvA (DUF1232 family)
MPLTVRWRAAVRRLKRDVYALYLAARDPRTPWYARAVVGLVAAYALSPIDLIPDFIPVIGYLDDVIVVPLGILLAIRLVPTEVLEEARLRADAQPPRASRLGLALILALWGIVAALIGLALYRRAVG